MKGAIQIFVMFTFIIIAMQHSSAQWIQTGAPLGENYNALLVTPNATDDTNIFAGTFGSGVFRSTNYGKTWVEKNTGLTTKDVSALAASGQYIFAGTHHGIFRSSDNGAHWSAVNTGLTNTVVFSFAVFPGEQDTTIFVGTVNSIFRTTDNGAHWSNIYSGFAVSALAVFRGGSGDTNIFAGTNFGLFRSTNNGTDWKEVDSGFTITDIRALVVSGQNLFAGTNGGGAFVSTNNGASWTAINTGLPEFSSIRTLAVFSGGENLAYLFAGTLTNGVFLSTDNGANWSAFNDGLTSTFVQSFAFSDSAGITHLLAGLWMNGVWQRSLAELVTGITNHTEYRPEKFVLRQNYPNPFNPTTIIGYDVPKDSKVKIIVFDMIGRQVRTLIDEEKSSGSYNVEFNARDLSSGVYFYQLQTIEFTQTKKLILMR